MSVNQLDDITQLFRYTWWADDQMLSVIKTLTPEQQTRDMSGSFPSVVKCAAHVTAADLIWFRRWHGLPGRPLPDGWPAENFDAWLEQRTGVRRDHEAFLSCLDLAELERSVTFVTLNQQQYTLPLGETLRHVVNHSTYHRGQVANFIRTLGVTPPTTDLLYFYAQEREAR